MTHPTSAPRAIAPWHLWVVGVLALLWNSVGAFDYLMTETRNEAYMSQFTPEQLAYFYGFPSWVVAAWALAVWGGVLGAILLLLRKRLAVPAFAVSLAAMVITTIYNFGLTNAIEVVGTVAAIFALIIFVIAVGLWYYARTLAQRGVLR